MHHAVGCRTGTFRATRRPDGRWNTDLLTTEDNDDGFLLYAGDVLETRVRLPTRIGACRRKGPEHSRHSTTGHAPRSRG
ncbi:hypothetical protein OK006_8380 [Actinobacteria bacterium OK006]|nr:hypothetical protein OK006_8380 [Actinobacteria bacterium OK006]